LTLRPMNPVEVEAIRAYLFAAAIARGLPQGLLHKSEIKNLAR